MSFIDHTNFSKVFSGFRQAKNRKSASEQIKDEGRIARSVLKDQFRADLNHHLGSDLTRSYVTRSV